MGALPFEWIVALRFLREGRMQTALIVAGTTIGVAVIVFITALVNSLQESLAARTLSSQAHIVVRPPEDVPTRVVQAADRTVLAQVEPRAQRLRSIDQWERIFPELERMARVTAASPMATGPGFASRGNAAKSIALVGIEPERFERIVKIGARMVAGQYRVGPGEAVIGIDLASDLGANVGDRIRIRTAQDADDVLLVTGIFDVGVRELNLRWVLVPLRTAQSLLGLPGGLTNIDLTVDDIFAAETVAQQITGATGLLAESWMATNGQILAAFANQTITTRLIRLFLVMIVALGIASVLVVSVVQKRKEIGILRAMGASPARIMGVFLIQGALVGVAGALAGSLLAALLVRASTYALRQPDGSPLITGEIGIATYVFAALVALVTGVLAALAPATPRGAARSGPGDSSLIEEAVPILALEGVRKAYNVGTPVEVEVLHGIDLVLRRGELAALVGPSGSGKSTLLNTIGLLERPTAGRVRIAGQDVATLDEAALTALRGRTIGFVFQFHHLLPAFTALENVMLPLVIDRGRPSAQMEARAADLLSAVGLGDATQKKPSQLSGGMQQRVAIARALAMSPPLVLADEPTGNLDTHTADDVFALFERFNAEQGIAFLIVTHDPRLAARCRRRIELVDGRVLDRPNGLVHPHS